MARTKAKDQRKAKPDKAELANDTFLVKETNAETESVGDSQDVNPSTQKFQAGDLFMRLQELIMVSDTTDLR